MGFLLNLGMICYISYRYDLCTVAESFLEFCCVSVPDMLYVSLIQLLRLIHSSNL